MLFSQKERAFRKAYRIYYPLILNTLYRKVENMEDAEDIAHEVFISYYHKFDEVRDTRTWLFGAMRFCLSNYYRKTKSEGRSSLDLDTIGEDEALACRNGDREVRMLLHEALNDESNFKDEFDRVIFELIAINRYTYEETAQCLGMSKRQVSYRYQVTSKRILDYLKKKGISRIEDLL